MHQNITSIVYANCKIKNNVLLKKRHPIRKGIPIYVQLWNPLQYLPPSGVTSPPVGAISGGPIFRRFHGMP